VEKPDIYDEKLEEPSFDDYVLGSMFEKQAIYD